jgi:hypothetical protein
LKKTKAAKKAAAAAEEVSGTKEAAAKLSKRVRPRPL